MKSQVLLTVWCNITGEAAGEIWTSSLSGVRGLKLSSENRQVAERGYLEIRKQVAETEMSDADLPNPIAVQQSLFGFYRNPSTYGMICERERTARVYWPELLPPAVRWWLESTNDIFTLVEKAR